MYNRFTEIAVNDFLESNKDKTISVVDITQSIFHHIQTTPELMNLAKVNNPSYLSTIQGTSSNTLNQEIGMKIKEIFELEDIGTVYSTTSTLIQNYTIHKNKESNIGKIKEIKLKDRSGIVIKHNIYVKDIYSIEIKIN